MASGTVGMAKEIGKGSEHEADEEIEHGKFMAGKGGGEYAAADKNAEACGEEKRSVQDKVAAEVRERMGQGGGDGAIDAEEDEQGAAAKTGQEARKADEESAKQLEDELQGLGWGLEWVSA